MASWFFVFFLFIISSPFFSISSRSFLMSFAKKSLKGAAVAKSGSNRKFLAAHSLFIVDSIFTISRPSAATSRSLSELFHRAFPWPPLLPSYSPPCSLQPRSECLPRPTLTKSSRLPPTYFASPSVPFPSAKHFSLLLPWPSPSSSFIRVIPALSGSPFT